MIGFMSQKRELHIQNDLFWEDENSTPNITEAQNWFNVNVLNERPSPTNKWMFLRNDLQLGTGRLFRGSLDYARILGFKFEYANALNWLPKFRKQCVSENAIFVELGAAKDFSERWKQNIFVRPVSPFKQFAGQVFTPDRLDTETKWLLQGKNIAPDEIICILCEPIKIEREYRLIFIDGICVGASRYMVNEELSVDPYVPQEAIQFGEKLAKNDYFANIFEFVLDVGLVKGQYKLIEVNGFETASFYAADLAKVYGAWEKSLTEN